MVDELVQRLNKQGNVRFVSATDAVVEGFALETTGNRQYGKNVYVATGDPYRARPGELLLGRTIGPGEETFGGCKLVRSLQGGRLTVVVVDAEGKALTRILSAWADDSGCCDEGLLAWFGPVEDVCTPWNDNDPSQCQVVTVDRLRAWAAGFARR